jgi:hypothetical protein
MKKWEGNWCETAATFNVSWARVVVVVVVVLDFR